MRLKDTKTQQLIDLKTIVTDNKVTLYSCGPTVYDYPHIGNWYAFLRWDLLVRTLEANGYQVKWVMNITDVGHLASDQDEGPDKVSVQAKKQGKTAWQIAQFYGDYFQKGLERLNFRPPDHLPKATDHIKQQIDLAQRLEAGGYTYLIDDGLYFDSSLFADYGQLISADYLAGLKAGARVATNPNKRQATDFALWKLTPTGQVRDMDWPSPWGRGFPGWHLECSAMAHHYLGVPLTIHTGGIDHIPVHHTNEIAQSEAGYQKPFAQLWLHSNFIVVDGQKMSKSRANFYTLEDLIKRGFDLADFRVMVFSSRYSTQANFSWSSLRQARQRRQRLLGLLAWKHQLRSRPATTGLREALVALETKIVVALSDDLNVPTAWQIIEEFSNRWLTACWSTALAPQLDRLIDRLDALWGLNLNTSLKPLTDNQQQLLIKRDRARQQQDWQLADQYRQQLAKQKLNLLDSDHGQIWQPVLVDQSAN